MSFSDREPVALYLHTPFCPSKCGYCDFNSYAMDGEIVEETVAAIEREVRESRWAGWPVKTVFFGGGTPTFLTAGQLERLIGAVLETHPLVEGGEVTSEANPGTVDAEKFGAMKAAGFNRISLGAQSFDTGDLMRLGRVHEATDVAKAVGAARRAGFESVNVDLMFALPGQSLRGWKVNLDLALGLGVDHLSLYGLTIEQNTRFYKLHLKGMLDLPDDEVQVEMYDLAVDSCAAMGMGQYEISNFGKPGHECRHNMAYWKGEDYLGYGPGAVGCVDRVRYTNMKHPRRYVDVVCGGGELWCESEVLTEEERRFEKLMLGLRLVEGVAREEVDYDFGAAEKMVGMGWLEEDSARLRLTRVGRHFCSEVTARLGV